MKAYSRIVILTSLFLCAAAGPLLAQEVIAGLDLLKTQVGQTQEDLSGLSSMCPGVQVIGNPIIPLRGIPLEDPEKPQCAAGRDVGETDTFIQRLAPTSGLVFPGPPVQIPIDRGDLHVALEHRRPPRHCAVPVQAAPMSPVPGAEHTPVRPVSEQASPAAQFASEVQLAPATDGIASRGAHFD